MFFFIFFLFFFNDTATTEIYTLSLHDALPILLFRSRAALAKWLTRQDNPLTWRSVVNRIWQYHFGNGIAPTPNDLGRMGQLPSHPELLDWLAVEFRDNGQSFMHLHRLILNSAVWKQASVDNAAAAKIDGSNRYLWKQNRRRLSAEEIRDAVLTGSGQMNLEIGSPGS